MPALGFTTRLDANSLAPALKKALKGAKNRRAILRVAGAEIVALTRESFRQPALRQSSWAPKRDGQPSNLTLRGALAASIRLTTVTDDHVSLGSDRKYAAIHQFGGVIRGRPLLVFTSGGRTYRVAKVVLPARPYLPFTKSGNLIPQALPRVTAAIQRATARQIEGR